MEQQIKIKGITFHQIDENQDYFISQDGRIMRIGFKVNFYMHEIKHQTNKNGYKKIQFGNQKNKYVHHLIWTAWRGEIPPNHMVIFLDKDTTNCHLNNLKCISKKEFYATFKKGNIANKKALFLKDIKTGEVTQFDCIKHASIAVKNNKYYYQSKLKRKEYIDKDNIIIRQEMWDDKFRKLTSKQVFELLTGEKIIKFI